jgi:hypothetical protein
VLGSCAAASKAMQQRSENEPAIAIEADTDAEFSLFDLG